MTPPLLQLDNIAKHFGAVRALKGVSFDLLRGEVHALLGENGAGKSTLIKIITGAYHPDFGSIRLDGELVGKLTPARAHAHGIACIYQQPSLFPDLSVGENIALRLEPPRGLGLVNHRARQRLAVDLLQRLGADISPSTEVRELSMPEQQLVEIGCALGAGARIVIMDEPTASLTIREQELLFKVVRDLRSSGVGVVYISHRLEEIFALADRVTTLRDGETVATTKIGDLNQEKLIQQIVGRAPGPLSRRTTPAAATPLLELRRIGCTASGVHDVSLEVRSGEIVALAGLVGAGRTELARILFGLTPADSGEVRWLGNRLSIRSPRQAVQTGIGYVPEDRRRHGVIMDMAVAANVTMAIHPRLFPGGCLRPQAERSLTADYISRLDIKTSRHDTPLSALSGGNQQKVALARWLVTRPKLLILDEPTQGVDVGAKNEIHQLIRTLADQGLGVLLISSDLPEVLLMADRIAVMRQGTVVGTLSAGAQPHDVMAMALGQTVTTA